MALSVAKLINLRSPFLQQFKNTNYIFTSVRVYGIKVVKNRVEADESWTERNLRLSRPMSPHLTIYKMQLNSFLSITHRGTGILLSVYAMFLGIGAVVLPHDFSHYVTMMEGLSPTTIYILKLFISLPFSYHFIAGIRHLIWDSSAKFLTNRDLAQTGFAILAGTVIASAALASM